MGKWILSLLEFATNHEAEVTESFFELETNVCDVDMGMEPTYLAMVEEELLPAVRVSGDFLLRRTTSFFG